MTLLFRKILSRLLWLVALAGPMSAHDLLSSFAAGRFQADGFEVTVKLNADITWPLVQDTVAPGAVFVAEDFATVWRPVLIRFAGTMDAVTMDGQRVLPREVDVALNGDHFDFRFVYPKPKTGIVRIEESYLRKMTVGFVSYFKVLDEAEQQLVSKVLTADEPVLEVAVPTAGAPAPAPAEGPSFREFLQLGVEHILTGYDHLLFLCGLLVACRRLSSMLGIITCFTVAHSITLGLAAVGVLSLPGKLVEAMIAASIVFVGVENLIRTDEPPARWVVTFAFGLMHGFGFAGALREMGLGADGAPLLAPLFAFNLGVELGQLAITLLVLPLLWKARQSATIGRWVVPVISVAVALAGTYWLLQRTVFA